MKMKQEILSKSPGQTKKIAESLAKKLLRSSFGKRALTIGLVGDLGGGKTTFVQGLAEGLGIKEKVLSPTFVLVKKFQITNPPIRKPSASNGAGRFQTFYHIDCYRIHKPKELLDLGFKEIISDPGNIVAVEWADRIKRTLPKNAIRVKFEFVDEKTRKIAIKGPSGKIQTSSKV